MNVETRVDGQDTARPQRASMEPRSYERGNASSGVGGPSSAIASMEPRSYERGNVGERVRFVCPLVSFNGATFV